MLAVDRSRNGIAIVQTCRFLEREHMHDVRLALEELRQGDFRQVVFDFTGCEHCYYRIPDILSYYRKTLEGGKGDLVLVGLSDYLTDIFSVAGHVNTFDVFESVDEVAGLAAY